MGPSKADERFEVVDALRGAALLGIVMANSVLYSLYLYLSPATRARSSAAAVDHVLEMLELTLIEGKFYTIFSVLFGLGFAILLSRARQGPAFHWFFLRRAAWLMLIGACHAILLWPDDILVWYAACGILLLPFARAGQRTILVAAAGLYLAALPIGHWQLIPVGALQAAQDSLYARYGYSSGDVVAIWSEGTYRDVVQLNVTKWLSNAMFILGRGWILKIYGCFLLGLWLGRAKVHERLAQIRPILTRIAVVGLLIGIPLNIVFAFAIDSGSWTETLAAGFGVLPLSAAYAAIVALAWTGRRQRLLQPLASVGRMALTNYIGQSAVAVLLFTGAGLGLGGSLGPSIFFPIALGIYLVQVVWSGVWLNRFRFGPLEWIWRMLTYGRWFALRKARPRGSVGTSTQ